MLRYLQPPKIHRPFHKFIVAPLAINGKLLITSDARVVDLKNSSTQINHLYGGTYQYAVHQHCRSQLQILIATFVYTFPKFQIIILRWDASDVI